MALSQWDLKYLNPQEQAEVLDYQNQWASNPNQQGSVHNVAETIRARYGYSGGADGSQYIPIETYKPPTAPTMDSWESPYRDDIKELMDSVRNQEAYSSPYEDLLNQTLSQIVNRPKFQYNPDEDAAYQAFRQRALAAGDKAYADNLGGMSAMTGGRPNSWAGTVASQARNQYVAQAEEAVIQFEDRAYSRYKDEGTEMYNLLNALNTQDATAYQRYRDSIGDKQQLADMLLRLEDSDFEKYKFQVDQNWKRFDVEYQSYNNALEFKRNQIAEAIDRTNLQGFVNNQDAVILGVPSGTLSQSARERAEAMEDYIAKQQLDIEQYKKEKEIDFDFDKRLIQLKESYSTSGGGGGSSSGSSGNVASGGFIPNNTETNRVNSEYKKFTDLIEGDNFKRMTREQKYNAIADLREEVVASAKSNLYGKNSVDIASLILGKIQSSNAYKQYYINYKPTEEIRKQIKQDTKPGGMIDFLNRNK